MSREACKGAGCLEAAANKALAASKQVVPVDDPEVTAEAIRCSEAIDRMIGRLFDTIAPPDDD